LTDLDQKVRGLLFIQETAQKQFQYRIDYYIALVEFKTQHPVRQNIRAEYVASWIAQYLNKNYHYELKPLR